MKAAVIPDDFGAHMASDIPNGVTHLHHAWCKLSTSDTIRDCAYRFCGVEGRPCFIKGSAVSA